jgi:hypothetical protein
VAWGEALNLRAAQIPQNSETDTSLDFAKDCGYVTNEQHELMTATNREIGSLLGSMISNPEAFLIKP